MARHDFIGDLRNSVVHVVSADISTSQWGTAFVVHRDEEYTYLLTCAHVIRDVGGEEKVRIGSYSAEVVRHEESIDVAVLRVKGVVGGSVIPLRIRSERGGKFSATGFSKFGVAYRKMNLQGVFGQPSHLYARGKLTGHVAWELQADNGMTFDPGMSGSPVFDEANKCVAIVAFKQGTGGIALSIEAVRDVWMDFPGTILADCEGNVAPSTGPNPRMNRENEIAAFERIAVGLEQEVRVLVIDGPSGMGKTLLLDECQEIATRHHVSYRRWILGQQTNIENILSTIERYFGGRQHFTKYYDFRRQVRLPEATNKEYYRLMSENFFSDLSVIHNKGRLLLLIDEYEKGDEQLREWLDEQFLPRIPNDSPLVAVVAGQLVPKLPFGESWIEKFHLQKLSFDCWRERLQQLNLHLLVSKEDLEILYEETKGLPLSLSISISLFRTMSRNRQ